MSISSDKSIHILVVDDEEIVVSLVRDALEDAGYVIHTADSGAKALEQLKEIHVDLLITDIRMPQMDGIELVRLTRQKYPEVGVIYMTGYANLNSAKDAIQQGAFDYILKPFELNEIRQAVSKAVERIKKDSAAKKSGQKLAELSDFNQMLLAVGDHKLLCTVSLRFVMMHCRTKQGSILYWDKKKENFRFISIEKGSINESQFTDDRLTKALGKLKSDDFNDLVLISSFEQHPVFQLVPDEHLADSILPPWFDSSPSIVTIPIRRADTFYGMMMASFDESQLSIANIDTDLLTMSASQLALSLENLFLLEESQQAYARLKELQDETIQLEKMATRGELSAEIGHELNNFLGVVAGNISLLDVQLKKQNYAETDKFFQAIYDNIEQMKRFTANLMDLTPIASKKEIIFFDKLLFEVIDYLKPQKRFREVSIIPEDIQTDIAFEADSTHVQQLLYNLFNNAADASADSDKKEITARTQIIPEEQRFRFMISDTGVGIDPDLLPKLFSQKFTTKENGHGFGLLVCKRIVDNHGGNLKVESTPGKGTTFIIDFPLAVTKQETPVSV